MIAIIDYGVGNLLSVQSSFARVGAETVVTSDKNVIRNADKIFFLDEGKIIDIGTFDELFANNAKFKNMFFAENLK